MSINEWYGDVKAARKSNCGWPDRLINNDRVILHCRLYTSRSDIPAVENVVWLAKFWSVPSPPDELASFPCAG